MHIQTDRALIPAGTSSVRYLQVLVSAPPAPAPTSASRLPVDVALVLDRSGSIFNANRWRLREPNPLPCERPQRFERLCIRALSEGVISEAKASELLGTTVRELVRRLDEPPEDGADGHAPRV